MMYMCPLLCAVGKLELSRRTLRRGGGVCMNCKSSNNKILLLKYGFFFVDYVDM